MRTALKVLSIVNIAIFGISILGNINTEYFGAVLLLGGTVIAHGIVTLVYIKK